MSGADRLDELVAAAAGDPLAAAIDVAERLEEQGRGEDARRLLEEQILPALEERVRAARERVRARREAS